MQRFLRYPVPDAYTASPIVNTPHQRGTFIPGDEPTLARHYQPQTTVYFRVHSWRCTFCGLGQMYNNIYPS